MWLAFACVNLAIAVMLGAFGAHGLKNFADVQQLQWWQTATQYFFYHALGQLTMGVLAKAVPYMKVKLPFCLMQFGMMIFSGSLYLLALGSPRWIGSITPVGEVLLIFAWLVLARVAVKQD